MIKSVNNLTPSEMEQFKSLYTKYFVEEAKRTQLGFPLLYEIITKKGSKVLVDKMVDKIASKEYLGYAYVATDDVLGFIVGTNPGKEPARITEAYVVDPSHDKHISLELYRKIAFAFYMLGRRNVSISSSLHNEMLMKIISENGFDVVKSYPDGHGEYAKRI